MRISTCEKERGGKMKKYLSLLLFTLLLSACVNDNQKIESLTNEEIATSIIALDKGEDFYDNKDYANALIHFKKAANLNNSIALFYLGILYDEGYGVPKDHEMAFKYYKQSADLGYVLGINNLGILYYYGLGVKKDLNAACLLYKKAVKAGESSTAFRNLGMCYENGHGNFEKNINKAIKCYEKSADLGSEEAVYDLAAVYEGMKDYKKSLALYKQASQSNDTIIKAKSLYAVGYMLNNGDGVPKDYKKAVEYFNQSAKFGYSYAYNELGIMYEDGEGVKKDYVKAFFNYRKAAELKNMYGLYNVARCYDDSIGVKQDIKKAIKYYNLSGDLGYSQPYYDLSVIYKDGAHGIKKDYNIAVNYLKKAAKMGNKMAKEVLASVGKYK